MDMLFLRVDGSTPRRGNEMEYIRQDSYYSARVVANIQGVDITGKGWLSLSTEEVGEVIFHLQKARAQHIHLKGHGRNVDLLPESVLRASAERALCGRR